MITDKLSNLITNGDLTQPEVDSIQYRLSPLQQRLFLCLSENSSSSTTEIQQVCAISNVSDAATKLNERLAKHGDSRRVVCKKGKSTDHFNEQRNMGKWTLVHKEMEV